MAGGSAREPEGGGGFDGGAFGGGFGGGVPREPDGGGVSRGGGAGDGEGIGPAGVVLAGGASSRFGSPKAAALLGGRAMIEYPLAAMADAGLHATVVVKRASELPALPDGVAVLHEPDEPRHPLRGIVTALESAGGPIVVCACDMPFVTGELIAWLAALPDEVAIATAGGRPQPLLGRYSPAALPVLRAAMESGGSVRGAVEDAGARVIGEDELAAFGDPSGLTADVDSPDALAEAEARLRGG